MESLFRVLIGSVFIYQLLPIDHCKVINQRNEKEINESEEKYELSNETTHFNITLDGAQVELGETSIKYTNATQILNGSHINAITHV